VGVESHRLDRARALTASGIKRSGALLSLADAALVAPGADFSGARRATQLAITGGPPLLAPLELLAAPGRLLGDDAGAARGGRRRCGSAWNNWERKARIMTWTLVFQSARLTALRPMRWAARLTPWFCPGPRRC